MGFRTNRRLTGRYPGSTVGIGPEKSAGGNRAIDISAKGVYPILRFTCETRLCLKIYFVSLKQIEEKSPLVRQTDRG
jgi:hypothetical protein